jgi:hypothetical protein
VTETGILQGHQKTEIRIFGSGNPEPEHQQEPRNGIGNPATMQVLTMTSQNERTQTMEKEHELSAEVGGALTVPDPRGTGELEVEGCKHPHQTNEIPAVHGQNEPLEY